MKKQSLYVLVVTLGFIFLPAVASAQSGFYGQHYAPQQSCYKFSQTVRIGGVIHRQYGTRCEPVRGYAPAFYGGHGQQFYQPQPRFAQHHQRGYRQQLNNYAFPPFVDVRFNGRQQREYCPVRDGRRQGGGYGRGHGHGNGYGGGYYR